MFQVVDDTCFMLFFVVVGAEIYKLYFFFEHLVYNASKLVCGGGYAGRSAMFSSHSSIECAEGAICMSQGESGHA